MYIGLHVKYLSFLSNFNEIFFLTDFSKKKKNTQTSNFMKIHPVRVELFHVERQTDMTNLIVMFCNSANVPKIGIILCICDTVSHISPDLIHCLLKSGDAVHNLLQMVIKYQHFPYHVLNMINCFLHVSQHACLCLLVQQHLLSWCLPH